VALPRRRVIPNLRGFQRVNELHPVGQRKVGWAVLRQEPCVGASEVVASRCVCSDPAFGASTWGLMLANTNRVAGGSAAVSHI
jgi:hypothetical protein